MATPIRPVAVLTYEKMLPAQMSTVRKRIQALGRYPKLPPFLFYLCWLIAPTAFAQQAWHEHYRNAQEALAASAWSRAENELLKALAQRQQSGLNVESSGLRFVDYLPHYWLGVVYFNLGAFEKAAPQFEQEKAQGVIQKAAQYPALQQYERVLQTLKQLEQIRTTWEAQQKSTPTPQWLEFETALRRNDLAAAQTLLPRLEEALGDAAQVSTIKLLLQRLLEERARLAADAPSPLAQKFEDALAQYVAGNYAAALRLFAEIEAQDPAFRQVASWRNKTRDDMARLKITPETITIVDTIQATALPVIAFASPLGNRIETRADTVLLAGAASDDVGIQVLRFNLNGKPLPNEHKPRSSNEAKEFSFQLALPLRLGENQIVVTALDNDPAPHQATYYKTVVRLRPWYQTPVFYLGASAVLLLSAGGFAASVLLKRRIAFVNRYNPYIAGAPVRNEKMFYGREQLLQRLMNTLPNNSLMLHGPRRIGKTSLLHQLKKRLESGAQPEYDYVPVFIDLQGVREERFFFTLAQDILEACRARIVLATDFTTPREYSSREFSADLKDVLTQLQARTQKKLKLVLLLDEVDTLNAYSARVNQQLRGIFMKSFAENLVAVLAGSYIRKQWESEGSPWYNFFEEIAVPPLAAEEARALIRGPVSGIFSYEPEALEQIILLSKCEPYRIQRLCVNVINRLIEMKRRRATSEDVQAVQQEIFRHETKTQLY